MHRQSRLISAAVVCALFASPLQAATIFWTGTSTVGIATANWNDGTTTVSPTSGDILNLGNNGTAQRNGGATLNYQRLRVGHNQTTPAPGGAGAGTLNMNNGAVINLTQNPGVGANNASLWVGQDQNGTLNINGMGTSLTSARLAVIGFGNDTTKTGILNITNGGSLTVTLGNILIGEGSGGTPIGVPGQVNVNGNLTAINDGNDLIVGVRSVASSFTQTGGLVNIQDIVEVGGSNSTAANDGTTFTISGGTFNHNGSFFAGRGNAINTVTTISGTAQLNTGTRFLVGSGGANGAVVNHSSGTLKTTLDVRVADAFTTATHTATYNLSGTGIIDSTTGGIVGRQGVGKFFQTGGEANFKGNLSIGNREAAALATNGLYKISAGDLIVGTVTTAANLNIAPNGTGELRVVGDDGTIDVTGNLTVNNTGNGTGTLAFELEAGDSLSMINVGGTATFNSGSKLVIDDSNATFGQFHYNLLTAPNIVNNGFIFDAPDGWWWRIIDGGNGKILQAIVPEPDTLGLVLMAVVALAARRRD